MPNPVTGPQQNWIAQLSSSSTYPYVFGTSNGNAAQWVQVIGAGAVVLVNEDGSSVTLNCSGGEQFAGPFKSVTSMGATYLRSGNGSPPPPASAPLLGGNFPSLTRAAILALVNPPTGATYYDTTNNIVTVNTGTPASPVWSRVSGGPNVQANTTNAQSIPNNAATVVTTWTAQQNLGAAFNVTTGVFTAPVAGFYEFEAQLQWAAAASSVATEFRCGIAKNGVVIEQGVASTHTAASVVKQTPNIEVSIQLAAGDLITIVAFQNSGGALALTNDGTVNFFCAELIQ